MAEKKLRVVLHDGPYDLWTVDPSNENTHAIDTGENFIFLGPPDSPKAFAYKRMDPDANGTLHFKYDDGMSQIAAALPNVGERGKREEQDAEAKITRLEQAYDFSAGAWLLIANGDT